MSNAHTLGRSSQPRRNIRRSAGALLITACGLLTLFSATPAPAASARKAPAGIVSGIPSPLDITPKKAQLANTYVGALQGNPSALSIVIKGNEVLLYWCDGIAPGDWFGGTISNGTITGTSAKGISVTAKLVNNRITGRLTKGGKTFRFTLKSATTETGVFRHTGAPLKANAVLGWIVLDNAVVGATNEPDGTVSDAEPFSSPFNKRKVGGGCLRQRLAIRFLTSTGNPGVIDAEIEAGNAGCDTTGIGPNG